MWSGTTHRTSPTQLNTTRVFALTHLVPRPTIGCKSCRIPPQRLHRARTICAAVQQDSLYSILGIERDATLAEINSAYREAVRSFDSPTETLHQAHCKQEAVKNAYDVLSNDGKRRMYNMYGLKGVDKQPSKDRTTGQTTTKEDANRGADVSAAIRLSFLEAALGAEREFTASARLQCNRCSGSGICSDVEPECCASCKGAGQILRFKQNPAGRIRQLGPCPACGGKGVQSKYWCLNCGGDGRAAVARKLRVKIPPGVHDGSMLRLNGQGDVGLFGGERGDLHLRFLIDDEEAFVRKGYNVYSTVPITYLDAVLGGHLQVQTVQGPMAVKVPAGTQHGTILELRNQGVQEWGQASSQFGCHYLTLHLVLPTTCQQAERLLLERFNLISRP